MQGLGLAGRDDELYATGLLQRRGADLPNRNNTHLVRVEVFSHSIVAISTRRARSPVDARLITTRRLKANMKSTLPLVTGKDLGNGSRPGCSRGTGPVVRESAERGFTLVELMIGLTVAAFLVMLGLPSFSEFLQNSEIRSTTESIVNGLRVARSEAANRNQAVSFTLAGGGNPSWSVSQVSDNSVIQTYSKQEGGTDTTVAIQPAGAIAVSFNGLGRVIPAAAGANNLQQLDISSILASGSRPLRIYVDDGHGIRVCDPSPALAALTPRDARAC
jgi:type IV fimbrial biogenesis protein FimT